MQNRSNYKQHGSFKQGSLPRTPGSDLNRNINFKNLHNNPSINEIEFCGYDTGLYVIRVFLNFPDEKRLRDFIASCPIEIRPDINDVSSVTKMNIINRYRCLIGTESKEELLMVIRTIQAFDPLDKSCLSSLLAEVGIKFINVEDLIPLIDEGKLQVAIDQAKEAEDDEILWELGVYCEKRYQDDLQKAIDCYQEIPESNKYYQPANNKLLHLILSYEHASLTEEQKLHYLKLKFRCSLNSGPDNQQLTDQFYNELCGYTDANPKVRNIRGDADTLIALADHMRTLVSFTKNVAPEVEMLDADKESKNNSHVPMSLGFINSGKNKAETNNMPNSNQGNYAGLKKGFFL